MSFPSSVGFYAVREELYPGALAESSFVTATSTALEPFGFTRHNTMACLATDRDETCQSWVESVTELWGRPYCLSGLGGLILAGRSGFRAALSHGPNHGGRERYIFIAGPHIAVGPDGEAGVCARRGRAGASIACGALAAILAEIQSDNPGATDDPNDIEMGWLRRKLSAAAAGREISDLYELTALAHDVIADDLERVLAEIIDTNRIDYAVATGTQVHMPGNVNLIQPGIFYAVVNGERHEANNRW